MGPGALAGANLLDGRLKQCHTQSSTMADMVGDCVSSTIHVKHFKKLISQEIQRLRQCQSHADLCEELIQAGLSLLKLSDTGIQFLLCETGKILTFHLKHHKDYRRRPDLV